MEEEHTTGIYIYIFDEPKKRNYYYMLYPEEYLNVCRAVFQ